MCNFFPQQEKLNEIVLHIVEKKFFFLPILSMLRVIFPLFSPLIRYLPFEFFLFEYFVPSPILLLFYLILASLQLCYL